MHQELVSPVTYWRAPCDCTRSRRPVINLVLCAVGAAEKGGEGNVRPEKGWGQKKIMTGITGTAGPW